MARQPTRGGATPERRPSTPGRPSAPSAAATPANRSGPFARANFLLIIGTEEIGLCAVSALHWPDSVNTDPALRQTVTLRRAVGQDRTLHEWRRNVASGKDDVRPVTIVLLDGPGGKPVDIWQLTSARAIRWTGPELDAFSDSIAYEELEVTYDEITWRSRV